MLIRQVENTILGEDISDNLWPEILLAMTYVLNLVPTSLLEYLNLYKIITRKVSILSYFYLLKLTTYVKKSQIRKIKGKKKV